MNAHEPEMSDSRLNVILGSRIGIEPAKELLHLARDKICCRCVIMDFLPLQSARNDVHILDPILPDIDDLHTTSSRREEAVVPSK